MVLTLVNKIRTVTATEYIAPLREGGSLPGIIRADDGQLYAMKFVGAGQGPKALIAELISGEIARRLGFNVPEIVFIHLEAAIARSEPNIEIQDLLQASLGLNLGLAFLSHALTFNPLLFANTSPEFASRLVWLDAYTTNVDRTPQNVNMLVYQDEIWLIDHGASLYFHHDWQNYANQSKSAFPLIKKHVLLSQASQLSSVDAVVKQHLNRSLFETIVKQIPDHWLELNEATGIADERRRSYIDYLDQRLAVSSIFVKEAERARLELI